MAIRGYSLNFIVKVYRLFWPGHTYLYNSTITLICIYNLAKIEHFVTCQTKGCSHIQQNMSGTVSFVPNDKLSSPINLFFAPIKVAPIKVDKRWPMPRSPWHGTGRTPAMTSSIQMETAWSRSVANPTDTLLQHAALRLHGDTWKSCWSVDEIMSSLTYLSFVFALATHVVVALATVVKSLVFAASPDLSLPVVALSADIAHPQFRPRFQHEGVVLGARLELHKH